MEFRLLKADEIEVKIKKITAKGVTVLLYKTARTDMQLLDETVGNMYWETDYKVVKDNLYCGIGIYDKEREQFVWKWDCGTESRQDGEGNEKKGEASDAFKRAGFKWGIGRELYTAPKMIFLKVETETKNGKYHLKNNFQTFTVKEITYENNEIKKLIIVDNKGAILYGDKKQAKASVKTIDADLQTMGIKAIDVAHYFEVALNELTDEMKQMAIKQKSKEISKHELDEYRDKQKELREFKKGLKNDTES